MKTKKYKITLCGSEDSTYIYLELDKPDFELLQYISSVSERDKRSNYAPTMSVKLIEPKTP